MRLIDADNFIAEMEKLYHYVGWEDGEVHFSLNDLRGNIENLQFLQCKDCIHKPIINDPRDIGGFGLRFPDNSKCPGQCDDEYYSWKPNDNWFCANYEKEEKNK